MTQNGYPLAKVFDNQLMSTDIQGVIPPGTNAEDSVLFVKNYIRNWITKQLLLNKANQNLSPDEKNIDQLVEDYRTSLLIYKYKQKLIEQKLLSDISEDKIDKYYEENRYNFILSTPVVKALLLITPKSAPKLDNVRKWLRSDEAKDMENLEEYSITNARKYDNFENKWIELKFLLHMLPGDPNKMEKEITRTKFLEKEDNENYYFLKITEIANEQTVAPLGYVRDEIILILKNKEKLEFEELLEKQINEEGLQKNYVKIY